MVTICYHHDVTILNQPQPPQGPQDFAPSRRPGPPSVLPALQGTDLGTPPRPLRAMPRKLLTRSAALEIRGMDGEWGEVNGGEWM